MRINSRFQKVLYPVLTAVLILAYAAAQYGCQGQEKNTGLPTFGSWCRVEDKAQQYELIFNGGDSYTIRMPGVSPDQPMVFPGTYTQTDNKVTFVDALCGTKFPGAYTFSMKDSVLTLDVVDDKYCGRRDLFTGDWHRTEIAKSAETGSDPISDSRHL